MKYHGVSVELPGTGKDDSRMPVPLETEREL